MRFCCFLVIKAAYEDLPGRSYAPWSPRSACCPPKLANKVSLHFRDRLVKGWLFFFSKGWRERTWRGQVGISGTILPSSGTHLPISWALHLASREEDTKPGSEVREAGKKREDAPSTTAPQTSRDLQPPGMCVSWPGWLKGWALRQGPRMRCLVGGALDARLGTLVAELWNWLTEAALHEEIRPVAEGIWVVSLPLGARVGLAQADPSLWKPLLATVLWDYTHSKYKELKVIGPTAVWNIYLRDSIWLSACIGEILAIK